MLRDWASLTCRFDEGEGEGCILQDCLIGSAAQTSIRAFTYSVSTQCKEGLDQFLIVSQRVGSASHVEICVCSIPSGKE